MPQTLPLCTAAWSWSDILWPAAQVPIAEGASTTLNGFAKAMYADFVHGQDGFGNTNQPSVKVLQRWPLPSPATNSSSTAHGTVCDLYMTMHGAGVTVADMDALVLTAGYCC